MAVYKDGEKKWRAVYRFTDWTGERKQTQKRGFNTKREALEWEREQLRKVKSDVDMTFESFAELYREDVGARIKETTWETKNSIIDKNYIVLLNKMDLENKISEKEIKDLNNKIYVSAKQEVGLDNLKEKIKEMFFSGSVDTESLIISNNRHKQALYRALENCETAYEKVKMNEFLDLISIYVTASLKALGEITGSELEEDLVNKIFKDFCCGK